MNAAKKQKVTSRDISPTVNKGVVFLRQDRSEALNCLERMGDGSLPKQQVGVVCPRVAKKCSEIEKITFFLKLR
jgi:hypothetical protein